ncbi:hypothetical protein H0N95_00475 [Candidatus Micrarchaeota archaeon]|nr:hypothetical protein [Candidatus Micrarchaeota archaeon]
MQFTPLPKIRSPFLTRDKKLRVKELGNKDAIAQAAMLGTKNTQEIIGFGKLRGGRFSGFAYVKNYPGKTIRQVSQTEGGRRWLIKNRPAVVNQTAQIVLDLMNRGVVHGDTHSGNVRAVNVKGKPVLKLFDFEMSRLSSDYIEEAEREIVEEPAQAEEMKKRFGSITRRIRDDLSYIIDDTARKIYIDDEKAIKKFKKEIMKKVEEKVEKNW